MTPSGRMEPGTGDIDPQAPATPALSFLEVMHVGRCHERLTGTRQRAVKNELLSAIGAGREILVDRAER